MAKFYLKTFGCAQNTSDSERIKAYYYEKGYEETENSKEADIAIINTCIVRESAENRVYGLIENLKKFKTKVVVTGCLVGTAYHDKTGKKLKELQRRLPQVDEFLPIDEIGFDWQPIRDRKKAGLVTISNGCNNFCSYCIVPMARGQERSRPFADIMAEIDSLIKNGFKEVVLIGQNVNSYGSDLVKENTYVLPDGMEVKPIMVKSMGKTRIPTLFPYLLASVAQKTELSKISFISSNPWDFSNELIEVVAKYPNIDRLLHLPIQSGSDEILKLMNRGYTTTDYLGLVDKIRARIPEVKISTDIIIGFPGETEKIFNQSVEVYKKASFSIGYLNKYSPRAGTVSAKLLKNDIPQAEKKKRWVLLDNLINKKQV